MEIARGSHATLTADPSPEEYYNLQVAQTAMSLLHLLDNKEMSLTHRLGTGMGEEWKEQQPARKLNFDEEDTKREALACLRRLFQSVGA